MLQPPAGPVLGLPALDPSAANPLLEMPAVRPLLPAAPLVPTSLGQPVPLAQPQATEAAGSAPPPAALLPLEVSLDVPSAELGEPGLAPATSELSLPPARTADPELGQAIKLMSDLEGVKAAMAMLAEAGRAPSTAPPTPGGHGSDEEAPNPAPVPEAPPFTGGAPSAAAGSSAPSGGGSAALYALMIALAAAVLGLWGRLELVPVRWRSVAVVALVERPG